VPTTSIKGVLGHLIGAAGVVEAIVALESLRHDTIPPTTNPGGVDPAIAALIEVVQSPLPHGPGPVLSNSFGFGGHNASVVLARP
jgi:3-oxoacyl-[acyl-carrier-protein] synthase II